MFSNNKKVIKQIYIYRDSHLPENGWIQACFNCYTKTSKTNLINICKTNDKHKITLWEIYIYVCPKCNKRLFVYKQKKEYTTFFKSYEKYILKYYPNIYVAIKSKQKKKACIVIQKWWKKKYKSIQDIVL